MDLTELERIEKNLKTIWNSCRSMEGTTDGSFEAFLDSQGFFKEAKKLEPFGITWQELLERHIP